MAKSRAKSCAQCRAAKSRCSLSIPCSRCVNRGLDCQYLPTQRAAEPRSGRSLALRPLLSRTSGVPIFPQSGGIDDPILNHQLTSLADPVVTVAEKRQAKKSAGSDSSLDVDPSMAEMAQLLGTGPMMPELSMIPRSTPPLYASPTTSPPLLSNSSVSGNSHTGDFTTGIDFPPPLHVLSETPTMSYSVMSAVQNPLSSEPALSDSDISNFLSTLYHPGFAFTPSMFNSDQPNFPLLPNPSHIGLGVPTSPDMAKFGHSSNLTVRVRSFQQGSLTGKMLLSQVVEYARLFSDGKHMPPFIYPPCRLSPGMECPSGKDHTCLPPILAVCTHLSRMFYARTPGSTHFIVQQIYVHLRQLNSEYENYDHERMLQSLQAAVIYGLLCSQCPDIVSDADAAWLVSITEKFSRTLYGQNYSLLGVDYICSSRSAWAFMESIRRVGCLLYLIDLLFHIDARTPSRGDCPEFVDLPLPSGRELWQPMCDEHWKKRYEEGIHSRKLKGTRQLTMGDLFMLKKSGINRDQVVQSTQDSIIGEINEWVKEVDDFSMLLWLAFTLEGGGQAVIEKQA